MRRAAGRIVDKLRLHGYAAYFAGGWVRDLLLHRKPKDIDIATSALPEEVLRLFPKSRAIGVQFGVVQVQLYGREYEVATFRRDMDYADGRHPSGVTFSSPEEDAARRDFTINGMFYDPAADCVLDYVHGQEDLRSRIIRTIGDPQKRFSEDKLRMLRAIRFSCCLNFDIESGTFAAIRDNAPAILQVSWERIRDELAGILTSPRPETGLDLLHAGGLLPHLLPEIASPSGIREFSASEQDGLAPIRKTLAALRKPSMILAMAALLHYVDPAPPDSENGQNSDAAASDAAASASGTICARICRRLKMSNEETDRITDLVASHRSFLQAMEAAPSVWMRLLRKQHVEDHLELLRAHLLGRHRPMDIYWKWQQRLGEIRQAPEIHPLLRGDDLLELGILPGPVFGKILREIEDLQYEGVLKSRRDAVRHVKAHYPADNNSKT